MYIPIRKLVVNGLKGGKIWSWDMYKVVSGFTSIYMEVQMVIYKKEYYLEWMFYTGTVVEGQLYQKMRSSFGSTTSMSIYASIISIDIILPVGSKDN